ncbi:MAG: penicillin acylase family protein [Actinomycetota bacterium]|nr:penicillin acylase family protein [Actinomycetota bacterium]
MGNSRRRGLSAGSLAGVVAALALVPASGEAYDAQISRTKYGVPHIKAKSIASLGFGVGYAFAEDNICTMADTYVTVNAQRSRYFGPDESYVFSGNGASYKNIDSDFYFQKIKKQKLVEELMSRPPPEGPLPFVRKGVRGYVAGYNRYLRKTGVDNIPDPRCRGAEWVKPIRKIAAYRRFFQLGILASSGAAISGISAAAPVLPTSAAAAERKQARALERLEEGDVEGFPIDSGSNAYGLGSEATRNGKGMVLGNPHFPWDGAARLYQMHLTIPGRLNVSGAGLYGVPLVLIGHTRGLAWSHKVASAWRFTPYELVLNPLDSHQYLLDGRFVDMEPTTVRVKALTPEGELATQARTLYDTEFGPMFDSLLGLDLFPWTPVKGFALKDVNFQNFRYLNHFALNNKAQSVPAYDRIQRRYQGIPWVNSVAADRNGRAYYSMGGAIPNVPDVKAGPACSGLLGLAVFPLTGIPVLDGSRTECDWNDDETAVAPDIFGPDSIPSLTRRDYVTNGNDSHWLSNPEEPLTGFDRIIGDEGTQRSLRTRLGLKMVQERIAGTDGLKGRRFTLRNLARVALGNRQYAGELWREPLVAYCEGQPALVAAGACTALEDWNGRNNLRSRGAVLFQRFAQKLFGSFQGLPSGVSSTNYLGMDVVYTQPYSAADPVNTPAGLNTAIPQVGQALNNAVADLQAAGIPMNARLGRYQYEERAGERVPIHGGPGTVGIFNAINSAWNPQKGYSDIPHGTSFIAAMGFRKRGCPARSLSFVTYGQSENARSPHATDYMRAFSRKRWNEVPFCAGQVRRAALDRYRVSKRR